MDSLAALAMADLTDSMAEAVTTFFATTKVHSTTVLMLGRLLRSREEVADLVVSDRTRQLRSLPGQSSRGSIRRDLRLPQVLKVLLGLPCPFSKGQRSQRPRDRRDLVALSRLEDQIDQSLTCHSSPIQPAQLDLRAQ